MECLLAVGRTGEAVAAAEDLILADPLSERHRALAMQALYQAGRQHDALAAFQDFRRLLSTELGLDPSPSLREMERQIISQTPLGRIGHPDDIGRVAVFLASEDSRWITGETLAVAGGHSH